jgi:hypothetical protein
MTGRKLLPHNHQLDASTTARLASASSSTPY